MSGKSFVYKNRYARKINGLYLNLETSDVIFVFDVDTDNPKTVPAHKAILSIENPVFYAMFYGPIKEKGDVPISDASDTAFKEFLQFFYLDEVLLSAENIVQVINLCKKYEMDECMMACETTLQKSLTIDDMCLGYGIGLILERANLIKFCEQKIIANPSEIIKSDSFLETERSFFEKILTLVSPNWSALETVVACMEWTKTKCKREGLNTSPKKMRHQLGDLFNKIPFDKLTLEEFSQQVVLYTDFFSSKEIGATNQKILLKSQPSQSFELQSVAASIPRKLEDTGTLDCDRYVNSLQKNPKQITIYRGFTTFSSNKKLLLTQFYVPYKYMQIFGSITEYIPGNPKYRVVSKINSTSSQWIFLSEPCAIEIGKEYTIRLGFGKNEAIELPAFKSLVQLGNDINVNFKKENFDFISRLIFQLPEN